MKQLDTALKIHKLQPEFNLLMGECKIQIGNYKEAVQYFSTVVQTRPRNSAGWEALIRCLYKAKYYDEALEQTTAALHLTNGKPIFLFYKASVLFALGKSKEAILQLEKALILQNQQVVDILARFKRNKSI
jgi:tetratricopeptide (TPR) repeat protein